MMLKRIMLYLVAAYMLLGALCLPKGDFSLLEDLPSMYAHCKATEDKDMTPIDFLTDHLINFDCIFDQHDHGDQQKPHTPLPVHHPSVQLVVTVFPTQHILKVTQSWKQLLIPFDCTGTLSDYSPFIFRPPIA